MRPLALFAPALLCLSLAGLRHASASPQAKPGQARPAESRPRLVGYFAEWGVYARGYNVADIPAARLTHVNYAFAKVNAGGECVLIDPAAALQREHPAGSGLKGNLAQLRDLKRRFPHLKTLLSVGGWSESGRFSDAAVSDESRRKFARSAVALAVREGFDGLDIDWEYPVSGGLAANARRPEDRRNCTLLLRAIRAELGAQGGGRALLLTAAVGATPAHRASVEAREAAQVVDWLNVMAYDFRGGWSARTGFHAPLFADPKDPDPDAAALSVSAVIRGFLDAGVPANKIVAGVPFYGRGWGGVKDEGNGLYQPHGPDAPPGSGEPGYYDYRLLAKDFLPRSRRFWNDAAKAPWLFDRDSGVMIGYEDAESLRHKAAFVLKNRLGGVLVWDLAADDADSTLLTALDAALRP